MEVFVMAMQSCARDCPEVLSPNPYPLGSPAGLAMPMKPTRQSVIHWRIVLGAGGLAWLLIAGLIGGGYALSLSASTGKEPHGLVKVRLAALRTLLETTRPALPEPAATPAKPGVTAESTPVTENQAAVRTAVNAQEPTRPTVAIQKAPVSPLLVAGLEDPVAPVLRLPETELAPGGQGACQTYDTQVPFLSSPADAAQQALKEHKLLFLLHLSGNFEDAKFT
jgi:hypothetical protein